MLLTEEEALKRLNSPDNLANRFGKSKAVEIPLHRPGRKIGVPNLSVGERNVIAMRSRLGERQRLLAAEFGTTQAHVSQLERGQDQSIDPNINSQVKDIAIGKLMESLDLIDRDKLRTESATSLSKIASNMASVVEKMSPKEKSDTNIQVVVYTPELRKESGFKVVDI